MLLIQFTGLSGAGKTTLALAVKEKCARRNIPLEVIDGDECRKTISKDLGFTRKDREENIRRLGVLANSYRQKASVSIIAAINPFETSREELRQLYNAPVVWIDCHIKSLIARDTKGLYRRALLPEYDIGKLRNLSGINDFFEPPAEAELIIKTDKESIEESAGKIYSFILEKLGH
ncbi:MAG: adenylyl-sulfate kinase [Sphingobacteriaceae bacterium]|nr:adenylyl-sulfate kinase [Sphingobacteriaceae bacterium]